VTAGTAPGNFMFHGATAATVAAWWLRAPASGLRVRKTS
jgi:hypothetical protein